MQIMIQVRMKKLLAIIILGMDEKKADHWHLLMKVLLEEKWSMI